MEIELDNNVEDVRVQNRDGGRDWQITVETAKLELGESVVSAKRAMFSLTISIVHPKIWVLGLRQQM